MLMVLYLNKILSCINCKRSRVLENEKFYKNIF